MQKKKIISLGSIVIGIIILLNSFSGITGFIVLEDVGKTASSILGIVLVISGILLLMAREGKGGLEKISDAGVTLESTDRFTKAIKKHDIIRINAALRNIGTGKGDEHKLSTGEYSISSSESGRVVFAYDSSHSTATLKNYDEGHDYKKMLKH